MKPGLSLSSLALGTALLCVACNKESAPVAENAPKPAQPAPAANQPAPTPSAATLKGPATYATLQPYFKEHCTKCHGDKPRLAGGLDLRSYAGITKAGDVVKAGDPEHSKLVMMISGNPPKMPMGSPPLPADDVKVISDWIKDGAKEK